MPQVMKTILKAKKKTLLKNSGSFSFFNPALETGYDPRIHFSFASVFTARCLFSQNDTD